MHSVLLFRGIIWMVLFALYQHAYTQEKPNILFIAVDDLRPELGCYGVDLVKSPNLDKLAGEGTVFTNHFVQVPTCGPSRQCLLTGMRPRTRAELRNNITAKSIANESEQERPESFIHHLKRNGYFTVGIGKISHSADGLVYGYEEEPSLKRELPHSWDKLEFNSGKWRTGWNAFFAYANGENRQSLEKRVKPYEAGTVQDDGYPDGLTTDLAIQNLKELKDRNQPFFLGVGFFKPHLPFNAPDKYWDLYDQEEMPVSLAKELPQHVHQTSLHESGEFNQYQLTDEKAGLASNVSDRYARKLHHAYYASISYIDAQIGKIIQTLQALSLDDNTIIIVWGDHGWHLGDHRVWGKHTLFDVALRSALIIKVPGQGQINHRVDQVVETVDIYPSLMDLVDIDMPYQTDGESFVSSFSDSKSNMDGIAFSYFRNGISMRTKRYRITQYFREDQPSIELYDHKADPNESKNIADENPEIVEELLLKLKEGNTGLYN